MLGRLHLANTIYNFCCSHVLPSCRIGSERRRMPRDRRRRMRIVRCVCEFCVSNCRWVGNSGCTGTFSPQTIQTGLHSGCVLAHIRHTHNKNVWITFNNFDLLFNVGFQLMVAGSVRWSKPQHQKYHSKKTIETLS